MYIQITTKCNMQCAHCAFSCTSRGVNMSQEVFDASLKLAVENPSSYVTIGGGEPTMHPLFLDFLQKATFALIEASYESDMPAVSVITNGKNNEIAIKLARLAQLGYITARLSRDQYHESIDSRVVLAFTRPKQTGHEQYLQHAVNRDYREISHDIYNVIKAGRARRWGNVDYCACDSLFINPKGDIYPCGCRKTKVGNILDYNLKLPSYLFEGNCEKTNEFAERKAEFEDNLSV